MSLTRLENQVEQFWKLENTSANDTGMSLNDKRALQIWDDTIHVSEGHYEIDIPFKSDEPNLPNNRSVAERRLACLGRKLSKNEALQTRYKQEMDKLFERGHAEKTNDPVGTPGLTWYIPHHAVTNINKPDKLRVVYDCAAEYQGTSLNKKVLQGPDLMNKLIGVLLRFREGKYAMMADVEAMFYQVKVSPQHRDALHFLWWKDGDPQKEAETYRMTVHLFGGVWCPSIASYALRKAAVEFQEKFDKETTDAVLNNFYVDDGLLVTDSEESGIRLAKQLRQLLQFRGFNLTKWISNSRHIIESLPAENRAKGVQNLDLQQTDLPVERALGVEWDTEKDILRIVTRRKEPIYTRRGLLSVVSSVYDPLGVVCPFVLVAKLLFQKECRLHKGWDDELEPDTKTVFIKWIQSLEDLQKLQIPRHLLNGEVDRSKPVQIHHFCDAYGIVSYLVFQDSSGRKQCSFLFGKSRLAPVKQISIPRLELCAAVTAVQVNALLQRELKMKIDETFYWTDSTIVLAYIKNQEKRFHTFVANIHEGSKVDQWRHVPSTVNPADDASRGFAAHEMNDRWLRGPEFLLTPEDEWPIDFTALMKLENDPEVKTNVITCVTKSAIADPTDCLLSRFSDWHKMRKSVAWMLKFITWVKSKRSVQPASKLSIEELVNAENKIIQYVQRSSYQSEMRQLKQNGVVDHKSTLHHLEPLMVDCIMRVGGRMLHASHPVKATHQLILPQGHHVSMLLVRYLHSVKAKHCGTEYVLSLLRTKYWIPKARGLIKHVIRNCLTCKKLYSAGKNQRMADLPSERTTPDKPPFSNVGIDCFGPFMVKQGRAQVKRYGCIFTCLAIRAIHIEMLYSLDADSFINALMRFTSRRGTPQTIRSDNGTNFVGGSKEVLDAMKRWNKSHHLDSHLQHESIEWIFNPPAASHMGGVWERQIRTVRRLMQATLQGAVLDDEHLTTVFCEVESVVNNRPITRCTESANDIEPLTPNHLLLLKGDERLPADKFVKADVYNRRWRRVQYLADKFWRRWLREYLPTIQNRQKWWNTKRDFCVGDIVLACDEATPRNCWPMGRVIQVNSGRDGLVRSAVIKTKSTVLTRPVNKLCLLETCNN